MSLAIKPNLSSPAQTGLENLQRGKGKTLEAEKARLKKATEEFESFFSHQMLKSMRRTIPKTESGQEGSFSTDLGKETWTDMFDMEIARSMSQSNGQSISAKLYQSLERLVEAEFGAEEGGTIKELRPSLHKSLNRPKPIDLPAREISIPTLKPDFRVLPTRPVTRTDDTLRSRFGHLIDQAASETKLDSALIASVIQVESAGKPGAVSPAGAKGLMQLMDSTAKDLGVTDAFDPKQNIMAGARFLKRMIDRFGDLKLGLAAYNAGPGNVVKHGGVPPFAETKQYIERVTSQMAQRSFE